jgi:hypothetical protein
MMRLAVRIKLANMVEVQGLHEPTPLDPGQRSTKISLEYEKRECVVIYYSRISLYLTLQRKLQPQRNCFCALGRGLAATFLVSGLFFLTNCFEAKMIAARPAYDATTLAVLRSALDEVLSDRFFLQSRSISALEIAEHILAQAARGERDVERLKASAFQMIAGRLRVNAA